LLLLPAHSRRCLPLISNVGHHGRSPCFRAFKAFARLRMKCPRPSLLLRVSPPNTWRAFQGSAVRQLWRSLVATLRGPWSHVVGSFHPSVCGAGGSCCSASNQSVVGASRRSAAPGSQSIGSQFLVRFSSAFTHRALPAKVAALFLVYLVVCLRQRWHTSVTGAPSQHAMPNPSIERTNNGGSGFTAFANAQPPLFASHLKR
jgi:hypothetical protein